MKLKNISKAVAVVGIAALALTACSGSTDPEPTTGGGGSTTEPSGPVQAGDATPGSFQGAQFSFSGHGGSSQEAQDAGLQAFADIVGAQYAPDGPPDLAQIEAQVNSGNVLWDLVVLSDVIANDPDRCGTLVEKWDLSKIDTSNLPEVTPVTECGIPMNANGWSFAINTEVFGEPDNPELTWEAFFDTEKYPGKRAIYSAIPQLQLEIGLLGDGVAVDDLYPLDVERSLANYDSLGDDLVFYTTGSESQQMIESDQVVACLCWSGRVFTNISNGDPWAIAEAAPPQVRIDYWGIPKGSKNVDLAHAAINFFLGAETQANWAEHTAYPSLNKNVVPDLTPAAELVNILDSRFNANRVDIDYWVANQSELQDRWTTWTNQYQ